MIFGKATSRHFQSNAVLLVYSIFWMCKACKLSLKQPLKGGIIPILHDDDYDDDERERSLSKAME